MTDTLFSDVSEFQCVVDDTYPYPILSVRVNDGTYQDHNFPANYAWIRSALASGKLTCAILYSYWRTNWGQTFSTMQSMINANGGLDPRVILMVDLESGGNPDSDQSGGVEGMLDLMAQWTGSAKRTIVYANSGDFYTMWPDYASRLGSIGGVIGAGYGANPNLPGQIAHQYTDGVYSHPYRIVAHAAAGRPEVPGHLDSIPLGCPPFGNCDMNSADGYSAAQFAAQCGIGSANPGGMTDAQYAQFGTYMAQLGPS